MSFFKRLTNLISPPKSEDSGYWIAATCRRCGETIRTRVDLRNDLSRDYVEEGGALIYFCRKTLMGSGYCFQKVEVELTFDKDFKLISREIKGGEFVDEPKPES